MVNIDRVNRWFWFRIWFSPLSAFIYSLKTFFLRRMVRKYMKGVEEFDELMRYDKFISCFKWRMYSQPYTYCFLTEKKLSEKQNIFIVDENLDWKSIPLMTYVIKNCKHSYPKFLLNNILMNKGENRSLMLWDLIDTFYGEGDLDRAISSTRSFFIEKSFVERHEMAMEKIMGSHISIVPVVSRVREGNRWYSIGEPIKTSRMVSRSREGAIETLLSSFSLLESRIDEEIKRLGDREPFSLRNLFTISK